jgi:hypothetical protein
MAIVEKYYRLIGAVRAQKKQKKGKDDITAA